MAGLKVKIGADASQFERTMRGVTRQVGGVKSSILGIAGATGAILAVNKAFDAMKIAARGAVDFIKSASQEAATFEQLGVQFEVMLGSAEKAAERMKEIEEFAGSTPFEISEVAKASKVLEGLGGAALATGQGLKFVGDLAAATGVQYDEMAVTVGRMYNQFAAGQNVDLEMVNRLQELGMLTKTGRRNFMEYNEAVKAGIVGTHTNAQTMAFLADNVRDVDGMMDKLAETVDGKKSMMADAMSQIKVAFGTGFNEGLKDALDAGTDFIPQFKEKMKIAGESIGLAISDAVNGDPTLFLKIGQVIGVLVQRGIELGMDKTKGGIVTAISSYLEQGGLKTGGVLPKGTTERITRGLEIEEQQKAVDFAITLKEQLMGLNREIAESRARKASQDLGLGGFNPFMGSAAGPSTSPVALSEDMKRVRQLMERVVTNMTPF